jgi:hypothetical protein
MKKVAFTKDSVVTVLYSTDDEALEEHLPGIIEEGIEVIKLNDDAIIDNYFYEALKISGNKLMIDSEKAKEIQRNLWREARAKKFVELDLEFMRALETGDTEKVKEIGEKKQALRDVTKLQLSKVPSTIKSTWPEILL